MKRFFILFLGLTAAYGPVRAFDGAKWIWSSSDKSQPKGTVCFRAGVAVTEQAQIKSADLHVTADNLYEVYLNGKFVGESSRNPNEWNKPKKFDVANLLNAGDNTIAIEAANTAPGPAGLLMKLVVKLADGQEVALVTDSTWKFSLDEEKNWQQPDFNDQAWKTAGIVANFGDAPWRKLAAAAGTEKPGPRETVAAEVGVPPSATFEWPEAVIFVGDDCSLYRGQTGEGYQSLNVTIFNPRNSRAFPEHDLPAPMKVGRKLFVLKPRAKPQLLYDAGKGAIGSPSVSFDGKWIYFSMVAEGGSFYHLYCLPAEGGKPQRLTSGPFHDIDPVELPDGRIVFTSTRIGTFEEYHNPPSRSLFAMQPDGTDIRPLTYTFIFDNEPEVLADGRILFIRTDNFFDRGKVETLLHAIHPDGTHGYTEFGLDLGPEYGARLRAFSCGSPAPMPDGRVAYVTASGIAVGKLGSPQSDIQHLRVEAGDVAALPDGRLLCTVPRKTSSIKMVRKQKREVAEYSYEKIGVLDPQGKDATPVIIFDSPEEPLHSPVFLGARKRPPLMPQNVRPKDADDPNATGILFCQNARFTKNTTAGWQHVRAMRVIGSRGLNYRSSHSYIVHTGTDVVELGTVPLMPDGSFAVEVPADMAVAFQAVDAEGRSELNEMSWIYVRPKEVRGCIGCHQPRQATPVPARGVIQALREPPLKLLGKGDPHRFRGNNAAVTGLMELQFDRFREVAGINRHEQSVPSLVARLKSKDEGMKITAAQRLAIFRDPAAAPALEELLRDESREVRVAAAFALAACGTPKNVPALKALCSGDSAIVAEAAKIAVENLTVRPFDAGNRDMARRAAVAMSRSGGDPSPFRDYLAREYNTNPFPEWHKTHRGDGKRFNSLADVNPRTIQAVTRSLGYLQDASSVSLLAQTISRHSCPTNGNLFLAEAAVEALGRIGTTEAEAVLHKAFAGLGDYQHYSLWYGDHPALIACHSSPVHYLIMEALDALGSTKGNVTKLVESVPTDFDRGLFPENDDHEMLTGRMIRRAGAEAAVVETCLAILGDASAKRTAEIEAAIGKVHGAWGGKPTPEIRAAQIISLACRDAKYEPRIRAAYERYREKPNTIKRVFATGIPIVDALPERHWVCFYLARLLGYLAQPASVDTLVASLEKFPTEFADGSPDPLGPGVLFLHNDLTPCWRACAAWALGRIGDKRCVPVLLKTVSDFQNAPDTRNAAAVALSQLGAQTEMRKLAANYPDISTRRVLLR
ncbi:MAG: hypothetical protein FJ395_11330 [Verrucomicrobia bacterium]|nr:hypothetical protein [Verrucomicrobiota bacterium]